VSRTEGALWGVEMTAIDGREKLRRGRAGDSERPRGRAGDSERPRGW
jgi:hypothetical protein